MAAIASRYARALVEVVIEQNIDPAIAVQQVKDITATVAESKQLRMVWESPAIAAEQKRAVLDAIAGQAGTLRPIRNFFADRMKRFFSIRGFAQYIAERSQDGARQSPVGRFIVHDKNHGIFHGTPVKRMENRARS